MGKIRTVSLGDIEEEETAKKKAGEKRAQKRAKKATKKEFLRAEKTEKPDQEIGKSGGQVQENLSSDRYRFPSGRKYQAAKAKIDKNKSYPVAEALKLLKDISFAKFDETVEAVLKVTEKGIKGLVSLPHGTGKQLRVKVADENLIESLGSGGKIDFDVLVASPAMMPKLAKIAKIIGPRGLMPNPKTNTISEQPEELAKKFSAGQLQFKTETDFPIIHAVIGKVSFTDKQLEENLLAFTNAVGREKIKAVFLKSTMGPSARTQI